jgi:hypothetical protein
MLEAIGAGSGRRIGNKDWADRWLDSPEFVKVKEEIEEINKQALATEAREDPDLHEQCMFSRLKSVVLGSDLFGHSSDSLDFVQQMKIVSSRTFLSFWRNPDYCFTRCEWLGLRLCEVTGARSSASEATLARSVEDARSVENTDPRLCSVQSRFNCSLRLPDLPQPAKQ